MLEFGNVKTEIIMAQDTHKQQIHPFRTHNCNELRIGNIDKKVKLSGWIHKKRDHGGFLFLDLRDHYGLTQCVIDCATTDTTLFNEIEKIPLESVVTIEGPVTKRPNDTLNKDLDTGEIEVIIESMKIENASIPLPFSVAANQDSSEDLRLKYRFLDLRRERIHKNIILRSQVISHIRNTLSAQGFMEVQTPILTASSPEGARDFLVPSRLHPGQFYALPQAPQMFKQLLMISGFDKYFQIAPCFRDEDARADRSPGEFYQLDMEMSFCTQDDVFAVLEPLLYNIFKEFGVLKHVDAHPFIRIPYKQALTDYGTDKPDLRNPLLIKEVTDVFSKSDFSIFAKQIEKGAVVKAIATNNTANKPRSFFDKLNEWARNQGYPGIGYINFDSDGKACGPIAKFLDDNRINLLKGSLSLKPGDSVFFACGKTKQATALAGIARTKLAQELDLIEKNSYKFCWIVDFPMFEYDEENKKIDFSHNPFSMPQGGLQALENQDALDVLAYQYDIVCNGFELSSGAIRNHDINIMRKAFEIAGYDEQELAAQFSSLFEALKYGAPTSRRMRSWN